MFQTLHHPIRCIFISLETGFRITVNTSIWPPPHPPTHTLPLLHLEPSSSQWKLIKRRREMRLNKGKQQWGLGKLLRGIKKVPAETEGWRGLDGRGLRCTLCVAQMLMRVFLSSHRFPKWLSTPGAQLTLWGVSECVH